MFRFALAASPEQWLLMARHGECSDVSALQRKIPDLGESQTPDSFLAAMKTRGYRVQHKLLALPNGQAVEVRVPELSLDFIFVTPELCSTFVDHQ